MVIDCARTIFQSVWGMFNQFEFPGTNMTLWDIAIGAISVIVGMGVLKAIIGIASSEVGHVSSSARASGRARISNERLNDER